MFIRDYEWYIRRLAEHVHMIPSDVVMVKDVAAWCKEHGVPESDEHKPLKLVAAGNEKGSRMLIAEVIPDEVIEERIRALRIRSQLKSVGYDRADSQR